MTGARKPPIDPLTGPTTILEGRIVTMDAANTVIPSGRVYMKAGILTAVQSADAPEPAGFSGVSVTRTRGTLYPGLIELHNHLSYNALRLWAVPKKFSNRDQWGGIAEYRQRVSGPMTIIGETPELLPALVRYVEAKCLLAGVTASQGIALFSNAGVRRFYRGIVRNVEATDEAALPEAATRIADVDMQSASRFLERLKKGNCFTAKEADMGLVVINGVPRFGTPALFSALKVSGETVKIGSASRRLFLTQDTQDPQVGKISLSHAAEALRAALKKLPVLAKKLEKPKALMRGPSRDGAPVWRLALDEIADTGVSVRPRLPLGHRHTGARALAGAGTLPLSQIVQPLVLDPLSVAGDAEFLPSIRAQRNLPPWLAEELVSLY